MTSAKRRMCPGCRSAMQPFFVSDVEIDRCLFCGGIWFDRGELSDAAGAELFLEATGGLSRRRCPACGDALDEGRIGELAVESCGGCGGTFLDEGELATLAGRQVEVTRAAAAGVSTRCVACGEALSPDRAHASAAGYVCRPCLISGREPSIVYGTTAPAAAQPAEVPDEEVTELPAADAGADADLLRRFMAGLRG